MSTVVNVGTRPVDLPGGRVLAPGEGQSDVDRDDAEVAALIADGTLVVPVDLNDPDELTYRELQERAKALNVPATGSRDELEQRVTDAESNREDS